MTNERGTGVQFSALNAAWHTFPGTQAKFLAAFICCHRHSVMGIWQAAARMRFTPSRYGAVRAGSTAQRVSNLQKGTAAAFGGAQAVSLRYEAGQGWLHFAVHRAMQVTLQAVNDCLALACCSHSHPLPLAPQSSSTCKRGNGSQRLTKWHTCKYRRQADWQTGSCHGLTLCLGGLPLPMTPRSSVAPLQWEARYCHAGNVWPLCQS